MKKTITALCLIAIMLLGLAPMALAAQNGDLRIEGECPARKSPAAGTIVDDVRHYYYAEVSEPTCTEPGMVWWICAYCRAQYTEVLPALGHDWVERLIYEKEGTCLESGEKHYARFCSRCGAEGEERIEYTGLANHTWGDWKQDEAPTCEKNGLKYRTCSVCGQQDWQYIKALGHDWDEGVITKEATFDEPGEITYTCRRNASHTKTEEIPAGKSAVLPVKTGNAALELEIYQTSPVKPDYEPGENVIFDVCLINTGETPLTDPGLEYSYLKDGTLYDVVITSAQLGISVLNPGDSCAVPVTVPINDTAASEGEQRLNAQGWATLADGAAPAEDMAAYEIDGVLYTLPVTKTLPLKKEGGLVLTVTQTSPVKSVYHLNDDISWEAVLINNGTVTVEMSGISQAWVEDGSSHTYTELKDLAPGESYTCSDKDFIATADVDNGILTLAFTGEAYKQGTGEVITSNSVTLTFPTEKYIPAEGKAALFLEINPKEYVSSYEVDGFGNTKEIAFTVTVTNTGETDVDFSLLDVEISGSFAPHSEPTQRLKPHAHYTFDLTGTVLNESQITPGSKAEGILGKVQIIFRAFGYYPDTAIESCRSDDVILEYKLTEPEGWTPETETAFTVTLTEVSSPGLGTYMVDDVIAYLVNVTNTGEAAVASADLHVILEDNGGSDVILNITNIGPGETVATGTQYAVTSGDIKEPFTVTNQAYVTWSDDFHTDLRADSEPVVSPVGEVPPEVYLEVTKKETSTPQQNPLYYMIGEKVAFEITVTNISDVTLTNVNLWDALALDYPGGLLATYTTLEPNESQSVTFEYECTPMDAPLLTNVASADGITPDEKSTSAISNEVEIPVAYVPGNDYPLWIDKIVKSEPENKQYYQLSETIVYEITVENLNAFTVHDVDVIDTLEDPSAGPIAHFEELAPGEKQTIEYKYTVTQEDVDALKVINYAVANYWVYEDDEYFFSAYCGPVESPTGMPEPERKTPPMQEDSCRLVLKEVGEGGAITQQHICATHLKALKKADDLLSAASDSQQIALAWQQSAAVWRTALEEEYGAAVRTASSAEAKGALQEEKTIFFLYLDSLETLLGQQYPTNPALVYEILTTATQDQVCEICYLRHNPGKARPDSLVTGQYTTVDWNDHAAAVCSTTRTRVRGNEIRIATQLCQEHIAFEKTILDLVSITETRTGMADTFRRARRLWQTALDKITNQRYKAADNAGRKAIYLNRTLFDKLVEAHSDVLEAFYPKNPEIVAEEICQMVRRQVLTLCEH